MGELPWWITVVILGREIGVTIVRFAVVRHAVIPASRGGKVKTVLQIVAIFLYLAIPPEVVADAWSAIAAAVMVAAVVMTVITGIDYLRRAYAISRSASREC